MSWGRVENPKKVFKVGDELKVLVKDIHDTKIALSLKFPESNPWANAAEDYAVGTVITGKVARMTDLWCICRTCAWSRCITSCISDFKSTC